MSQKSSVNHKLRLRCAHVRSKNNLTYAALDWHIILGSTLVAAALYGFMLAFFVIGQVLLETRPPV